MWLMGIACYKLKAINTSSDYVTLIAFPRQQLSGEGTSILLYAYIATRVILSFFPVNEFSLCLHTGIKVDV